MKGGTEVHAAGYESLAACIVKQAVDDYVDLYKHKKPDSMTVFERRVVDKKELDKFFSDDGEINHLIGDIDPDLIRNKLENECPNFDQKLKAMHNMIVVEDTVKKYRNLYNKKEVEMPAAVERYAKEKEDFDKFFAAGGEMYKLIGKAKADKIKQNIETEFVDFDAKIETMRNKAIVTQQKSSYAKLYKRPIPAAIKSIQSYIEEKENLDKFFFNGRHLYRLVGKTEAIKVRDEIINLYSDFDIKISAAKEKLQQLLEKEANKLRKPKKVKETKVAAEVA